MILCLVTDRRRLGAAIGRCPKATGSTRCRRRSQAAAGAGVDFIQIREPDLEAGELAALVRSLMRVSPARRPRILVNDRLDVALAARARGVHLKEQSILPDEVRRIAPPGFVIGCSVHGIARDRCTKVRGLSHCRDGAAYSIEASGRLSG